MCNTITKIGTSEVINEESTQSTQSTQSNNITIVKLDTVHLYIDKKKNILFFDILNSKYSKNNSIIILEYFKNFWFLAKEQKCKYFLVIKINSISVYPLSFYNNLVSCLNNLNSILQEHLHSCAFLCNNNSPLIMLKPLFSMYKFSRPYKICCKYEDVLIYFNNPNNRIK